MTVLDLVDLGFRFLFLPACVFEWLYVSDDLDRELFLWCEYEKSIFFFFFEQCLGSTKSRSQTTVTYLYIYGIDKQVASVHYHTVQEAITNIKSLSAPVYLDKTDIKNAFDIVPIHPDSWWLLWWLLGYWQGHYYHFKVLPMGCRLSCALFEVFSTTLQWIAQTKLHIPFVIHVLDDFLIMDSSFSGCQRNLTRFVTMCQSVGVPIVPQKTSGPSTCLPFLGIELDTVSMESRLPPEKKSRSAENWLPPSSARGIKVWLSQLQSVVGLLNFACRVLPARAFLRRVYDCTKTHTAPYMRIRITSAIREDLNTWLEFLSQYNCKSMFIHELWAWSPPVQLFTDAAQ